MLLTGKTAIITGATGMIGREIARACLDQGCRVVLGDIDEKRLHELATELAAGDAVTQAAHAPDDTEAPGRLVGCALDCFGHLDIVITASGLIKRSTVVDSTDAELAHVRSVNFDYVFKVCRAAVPHMSAGGAVVNLASLSAHTGRARSAHYAAAKAAVVAFTKSLAEETAPRLRANCISPGFVETPLSQGVIDEGRAELLRRIPLGRFGTTIEVARTVVFLCSDWASYITGQTIHVNGGMYSPG